MYDKFATAINCVDGRVQLPVIEWIKKNYYVDFVDMVTEPGPDKIVCDNHKNIVESIKDKVEISIKNHGSNVIVLVGHHDCAGNPTDENNHMYQIRKGIEVIKSWNFGVEVIGLYVDNDRKINLIP